MADTNPPEDTPSTPPESTPEPAAAPAAVVDASKKLPAGLCGILLGSLGVHKFILGYNTEGLILLIVTLVSCGFAGFVTGIIGIVEGIIYLTKSDEEFYSTYIANKKAWF